MTPQLVGSKMYLYTCILLISGISAAWLLNCIIVLLRFQWVGTKSRLDQILTSLLNQFNQPVYWVCDGLTGTGKHGH